MGNEVMEQQESNSMMAVIERVAMSPDSDIAKLEKMIDMQERVLNRNAKQAFTADLAAMQIELPRVIERAKGHNSVMYARLEDINDSIRPTLHKYGFAVTFRIKHESNLMWITTVLSHRDGHSEETSIPLALDTSGSKNAVQAVGSTISYGKRYGICMMLNISTGDDTDGHLPAQQEAPKPQGKPAITDARLTAAIAKIKAKEYTVESLHKSFELTEAQQQWVADEVLQ